MTRKHEGGYAKGPWAMVDARWAAQLSEVVVWAYGTMRADAARATVRTCLTLVPHVRPGRDGRPPSARVSLGDLAEESGMKRASVSRALARLCDGGFIVAERGSRGGATSYAFSAHLAGARRPRADDARATEPARDAEGPLPARPAPPGDCPWRDGAGGEADERLRARARRQSEALGAALEEERRRAEGKSRE